MTGVVYLKIYNGWCLNFEKIMMILFENLPHWLHNVRE